MSIATDQLVLLAVLALLVAYAAVRGLLTGSLRRDAVLIVGVLFVLAAIIVITQWVNPAYWRSLTGGR